MLKVDLTKADGESFTVFLACSAMVVDLKRQVVDEWGVPLACQNIALGTEVLNEDTILLQESYTLITSIPSRFLDPYFAHTLFNHCNHPVGSFVIACLKHSNRVVRIEAVKTLVRAASKGDGRAMSEVITCLSRRRCIRQAALRAIADDGLDGEENLLPAVRLCLLDRQGSVRAQAIHAIAKMTNAKYKENSSLVIAWLKDPSREVRLAARTHIRKLLSGTDKDDITHLMELRTHPLVNVRVAAILAIIDVAERGDRQVVSDVVKCLEDPRRTAQWAAIKTLSRIAVKSDHHTMNLLIELFHSYRAPVRKAAIEAMARIANQDDQKAIQNVLACLYDQSPKVTQAARSVLRENRRTGVLYFSWSQWENWH